MNRLLYSNNFLCRGTRHFIFFMVTVLAFTFINDARNGANSFLHTFWTTFLNALFFFGYAYITIFLLIPEFLITRKIGWFVLLFVLVGIGLSALKLVVSDYIFYSSISPENIERNGLMNLRFIVVNTKDMSFIVALFCIAKYAKDYLFTEQASSKLETQHKEATGKLLQSQFDPHFMFNNINNLYALSLLNPEKTNEVIRRMKMVLNYIIKESRKDTVSLKEEVELVKNYIELEKLRYGKRLKVNLNTGGDLEDVAIPPMILFFLAENCFKHGSSLDAGTPWININVVTSNGEISLLTENSKPKSILKQESDKEEGKGFINLRKRLDIIYQPKGYSLKIESFENSFKVEITLREKVGFKQNTYR